MKCDCRRRIKQISATEPEDDWVGQVSLMDRRAARIYLSPTISDPEPNDVVIIEDGFQIRPESNAKKKQ